MCQQPCKSLYSTEVQDSLPMMHPCCMYRKYLALVELPYRDQDMGADTDAALVANFVVRNTLHL